MLRKLMVLFYLCIDTIEEVHFTKYYVTNNNYGYMERGNSICLATN